MTNGEADQDTLRTTKQHAGVGMALATLTLVLAICFPIGASPYRTC